MRGLTENRLCRTPTPKGNSPLRGKGHTLYDAADLDKGLCGTTPPG